ncbi:ATP-binding protein [Azospirillum thermophilum]|uniref:ATP-binding protein n=1 Tax=Azospirillum thermophilum TaxID=2202148 RepID=UPI001FE4465E|nr:ATP-binding protein [Azospirillum thermophilum]
MALQAALRCSDMTRRLLTFARRQTLNPEPVDLHALAAGMGELMERTLGRSIAISIAGEEAGTLWPATVDRSQAESALLNLVINARDAMPQGGRLTIRTANARLTEPLSGHGITAEPGDYVVLSVADTGCGMPPEVLERAFEPFFTTKETGKGTGLGLSMIYGFVKQSGGLIRIDSAVGQGTTFSLYLPRAAAGGQPAAGAADGAAPLTGRGETVLVVDDDADVRRVTVQAVRDLGYRVLEAEGAEQALAQLTAGRRVDLLFTDIVMPGMNGRELAREGLRRCPGLRVLFASGYADGTAAEADAELAPVETLAKPYRDADLARALHRALDDGTPDACAAGGGVPDHGKAVSAE